MVDMLATVPPPNGKAILTTNTDVTIDHFEFSGAQVADQNGAGSRYQGGNPTITNSFFHDNLDGLLTNPDPAGIITIRNSELAHNGAGDGRSHNLYVNDLARLTIADSYFHDAVVGHEIKSRARITEINGTRIAEGPDGTASYSVDLPNGGVATISNNIIEQGPNSQNPAIIHFGGEPYGFWDNSSLPISNNTIVNDLGSGSARLLLNQTGVTAQISDNIVYGLTDGQIAAGPASISGIVHAAVAPNVSIASSILSGGADRGDHAAC